MQKLNAGLHVVKMNCWRSKSVEERRWKWLWTFMVSFTNWENSKNHWLNPWWAEEHLWGHTRAHQNWAGEGLRSVDCCRIWCKHHESLDSSTIWNSLLEQDHEFTGLQWPPQSQISVQQNSFGRRRNRTLTSQMLKTAVTVWSYLNTDQNMRRAIPDNSVD